MIERLLKKLIEIPSVSGQEKEIARFVFNYLKSNGLRPKLLLNDTNVFCEIGKGKRTLVLNSHLDTVPPVSSWTRDPFEEKKVGEKIYGLGASDAKSSLVAMITAIIELRNSGEKLKGKVIFLATDREETGGSGMEKLAKELKFDAVVIGEPTDLNICTAQKGLLKLKLIAMGKASHASLPLGINAIQIAANDIINLSKLRWRKKHRLLGYPSIQVTIIQGGIKSNIIPDRCEFILDSRTTPIYPNDYILDLIKKRVRSQIEIMSNRIFPKETDPKEDIVRSAKKANPDGEIKGFFAISDFAFIDKPSIILGPGKPGVAHAADEYVEIHQLRQAVGIYKKIIKNFLL